MVGTGIAANFGILIKGAPILQKINTIDTVVFDKTGTLTSGRPQVKDLIFLNEKFKCQATAPRKPEQAAQEFILFMAYLIEKQSEHPLAVTIVDFVKGKLDRGDYVSDAN